MNRKITNKLTKARAIYKLRMFVTVLLSMALFYAIGANAEVRLPNGQYIQSAVDLRVKVMGGYIDVERAWYNNAWTISTGATSLKFTYNNLDGAVQTVIRGEAEYTLTSPGVFVLDANNSIRATQTGYRWQDREGNWIEFDASGKGLKQSDRNNVQVSFQYDAQGKRTGVLDHFGTQVLWYEYTGSQISAIRDATNRRVQYQFTGSNLTTVIDIDSNTWTYTYDGANKLTGWTDPLNRKVTITYLPTGRIGAIKDQDGVGVTYTYDYDSSQRQYYVREVSPTGEVLEYWYEQDGTLIRQDQNSRTVHAYTKDGRKGTVTDVRGNKTVYEYDEWGNLLNVTYPDQSSIAYQYDSTFSNLLKTTNEKGVIHKYEYDSAGNLIRETQALGLPEQRVGEFAYDSYGNLLTTKNLADAVTQGTLTTYTYDNQGNVVTLIGPENSSTTLEYDSTGNVLKLKDPRGKDWKFSYTKFGEASAATDPFGKSRLYTYDALGNLTKSVDRRAKAVSYTYDKNNNVTKLVDPDSKVTTFEYDVAGRMVKLTDAAGKSETLSYDPNNRPSKTINGIGETFEWVYGDANNGLEGLLTGLKIPGVTYEMKYDALDRVVQQIQIGGQSQIIENMSYDTRGNLTLFKDGIGKTTKHSYDALDRWTKTEDALGYTAEYSYDSRDNLIAVKAPNGKTTKYEYDRADRLSKLIQPRGEITQFQYDADGNVTKTIDAKGQSTQYVYDDAGRVSAIQHFKAGAQTAYQTINLSYDDEGNLAGYSDGTTSATYAYDNMGRQISETVNYGAFNLAQGYTYYPNGLKQSYTGPDGVTYTYTYDGSDKLQTIQLPTGAITYNSYQFEAPAKITFPGGITRDYAYDGFLRLTSIVAKDGAQSQLLNLSYSYDNADDITKKVTAQGEYAYTYDDLHRLTNVSLAGATQEAFTYDGLGNRLTDSRVAGNWTYNDNNQLTAFGNTTQDYDANGNVIRKITNGQTTEFVYDNNDAIVAVKENSAVSATYYYDPFGRRLWKELNGVRTYYAYADEGLVGEYDSTGVQQVAYGYVPDTAFNMAPMWLKNSTGYFYYQVDHLGAPVQLTAGDGTVVWKATYDVFGKATVDPSSTLVNNLRFPGQYFDQETGLHYNYARVYDPITGRYLQVDAEGLAAGLNLYTYAQQNPVTYVDASGRFFFVVPIIINAARVGVMWCVRSPACRNAIVRTAFRFFKKPPKQCKLPKGAGPGKGSGASPGGKPGGNGNGKPPGSKDPGNKGPGDGAAPPGNKGPGAKSNPPNQPPQDPSKPGPNPPTQGKPTPNKGPGGSTGQQGPGPGRWKVGDDVYKPTSKGTDPAWSTVRSRTWKNEAVKPGAAEKYGAENIERMKGGNAPQRFNPQKGGTESMELSHEPVPQRSGGKEFVPRWPQDHAAIDPFRRPGY